ncbi:nitrogen fixation protein FixH [Pelagivirga sediminicola]|uniref:Nitrogen fixation protein FixH n=1 Tax=Pelagivirga sediminicola TaxID=2170575 RepID=A0A2T7G9T2_9RHOB|nr:FixH family protein [Pelagivirga sediminicola]PVA11173.1 nitrogen fixation protein FixH [Pelagivirga sediminicola]
MATREITGRHVLFGFVAAFGVIIGVNLLLAYSAVSTFPGLEVENSYVASQQFDDRRGAQEALGWTVDARHRSGILTLAITDTAGKPVEVAELDAVLGRATHVRDDTAPDFRFDGAAYVAPVDLAPGNWNIRMEAVAADGTLFQQRVVLHTK